MSLSLPVAVVGSIRECAVRGLTPALALPRTMDLAHYLSAGAVGFARGVNDTPKLVALLIPLQALGGLRWELPIVAATIAVGGVLGARRVAQTMSHRITAMTPEQGFVANVVTASLVLGASRFGLPVSTTHVSTGSLFGLGAVTNGARWGVIGRIIFAWIATIPFAAACGALFWLGLSRHQVRTISARRGMCAVTLAAAVCCVLRTSAADAGAWTQDEGAWFLKIGYDRWVTSHRFDSAGLLVPYRDPAPPRFVDEFRSQALRVYAEYGLTSASTVIVSGGYEWLSSEGDGTVDRSSGLSDPRLQFRRRLVDRPFVASVIGDFKLPIRTSKAIAPALGTGAIDYGGGFAVGGSLGTLYVSTEAGYLVRGGRFADQVPFAAEAGWSIRHDMVVRARGAWSPRAQGTVGGSGRFRPGSLGPS